MTTNTYKAYLTEATMNRYSNDITIIEVIDELWDGAVVRFTCKDEKIINKIFNYFK